MEVLRIRKVRKLPVEVTVAGPLTETSWSELADWCDGQRTITDNGIAIAVHTLEGVMLASHGDWIVRGVRGEYYPIKADILADTYEDVVE